MKMLLKLSLHLLWTVTAKCALNQSKDFAKHFKPKPNQQNKTRSQPKHKKPSNQSINQTRNKQSKQTKRKLQIKSTKKINQTTTTKVITASCDGYFTRVTIHVVTEVERIAFQDSILLLQGRLLAACKELHRPSSNRKPFRALLKCQGMQTCKLKAVKGTKSRPLQVPSQWGSLQCSGSGAEQSMASYRCAALLPSQPHIPHLQGSFQCLHLSRWVWRET